LLIGAFFNISGFTIVLDANIPVSGNKVTYSDTELPSTFGDNCGIQAWRIFQSAGKQNALFNVFLNAGFF